MNIQIFVCGWIYTQNFTGKNAMTKFDFENIYKNTLQIERDTSVPHRPYNVIICQINNFLIKNCVYISRLLYQALGILPIYTQYVVYGTKAIYKIIVNI